MNNFIKVALATLFVFLLAPQSYAQSDIQDKQAKKEARKAARKAERAYYDSLRMEKAKNDSINIGYGYTRKRSLTTSVSRVSTDEVDISSYQDIGSYLRGRVSGLLVTKVGGEWKYTIRGVSTINGSTDPLFIVDGIAVQSIDYLNPQDVASVEVMKDGSAAMYGTRGANGVILITTKKPEFSK